MFSGVGGITKAMRNNCFLFACGPLLSFAAKIGSSRLEYPFECPSLDERDIKSCNQTNAFCVDAASQSTMARRI